MILYCDNPPWSPQGIIVMVDPNCSNGIPSRTSPDLSTHIVILTDNFLEWIARWIACGLNEFAHSYNDDDYPSVQRDYLEDHIRLNPAVKWTKEKLEKLDLN